MPRTAAFTSGVLQELLRQLEYAPRETHLRQMDAAEDLLNDLHPDRLYPEDFITFRITGYRSDRPGDRVSVVGAALQRDLVTFIQALSWDLDLPTNGPRGSAVEMDALARRLGVSRRTLQRCRSEGLVLHFVRQDDGHRRLACYPDALDRFLNASGGRLASASSFSRTSKSFDTPAGSLNGLDSSTQKAPEAMRPNDDASATAASFLSRSSTGACSTGSVLVPSLRKSATTRSALVLSFAKSAMAAEAAALLRACSVVSG